MRSILTTIAATALLYAPRADAPATSGVPKGGIGVSCDFLSSCGALSFRAHQLDSVTGDGPPGAGRGGAAHGPDLRIVARDFELEQPERVAGGRRTIRIVNLGHEPHYAGLIRIDSGRTMSDFIAWRNSRSPRPGWLVPVGGIAPVVPGDSADLELDLRAGRHVIFCSYPSPDGTSHITKGMLRELVVEGEEASEPPASGRSAASLAVTLRDFAFAAPATIRAGPVSLAVSNDGAQLHQLLVIRLPQGVSADDEVAWFQNGSRGARPGVPSGGVLQLPPGKTVVATLFLTPGKYLLLCTAGDANGRPHHALGMRALLEVTPGQVDASPPIQQRGSSDTALLGLAQLRPWPR